MKDFEQLGVHADIAFGIVRFRAIVLGRLNADHAFIPTERGPRQHIDFIPAKTGQRSEKENLVLLGMCGRQFLASAFEQFCQVEGASVAWHTHALDLDPGKWYWFGDLHKIANPRNRVGAEERASPQDETADRNASALLS